MIPHNEGFYQAAYIAALAMYTAYAASIWWRGRRLRARVAAMRAERMR